MQILEDVEGGHRDPTGPRAFVPAALGSDFLYGQAQRDGVD